MKNHLNKKLTIGYFGSKSTLAKSFELKYSNEFMFKPFVGDIRNYDKIKKWLIKNKDINIIINFAAITSVKTCEKDKKKAFEVNYKSVVRILNIINAIETKNLRYFLSLSTSHVFKKSKLKLSENSPKEPANYYGYTKLKLENYILKNCKKYNFRIGIARVFNYYNGNSKVGFFINDIKKILRNKNKKVIFNNINTYRDFISIRDINSALFKMIKLKLKNDYNVCSGERIFLPDIINKLNKRYKNKTIIYNGKFNANLIGSNNKLKKRGWTIMVRNTLNEICK